MKQARSISVIIPNYNGEVLLRNYLPATFAALEANGSSYEVIIVDDCSTDASVAFIKANYPDVILIENSVNKGFSYSCNMGINAAGCELIFLLNSDVKLFADYFKAMQRYFDRPDIFGVTGRIIDMTGNRIQDAARMPGFNGFKIKSKYFYYTDNAAADVYTFYLSGANALVDAVKLKQLKGFDELFSPFYGEDLDLGIRAWRNGWKCYYEHNAICRHEQSATTKNYKTPAWVKQIYFRNRFFVHTIHLNRLYLALWFLQVTLIDLLPKLLTGKLWVWKSYTDLFKYRKEIKQSIERNQQLRKQTGKDLSLLQVMALIKDSVKNQNINRFKV